jgi:hypothetical protein
MGGLFAPPRTPGAPSRPKDPYLWIIPIVVALAFGLSVWLVFGFIRADIERSNIEYAERYRGAVVVRVCRDGTHIWKLRDGRMQSGWGVIFDPNRDPKDICD